MNRSQFFATVSAALTVAAQICAPAMAQTYGAWQDAGYNACRSQLNTSGTQQAFFPEETTVTETNQDGTPRKSVQVQRIIIETTTGSPICSGSQSRNITH